MDHKEISSKRKIAFLFVYTQTVYTPVLLYEGGNWVFDKSKNICIINILQRIKLKHTIWYKYKPKYYVVIILIKLLLWLYTVAWPDV